jgi:hypothetical protein
MVEIPDTTPQGGIFGGMIDWLTGEPGAVGSAPDRMAAAGQPMNRGILGTIGNAFADDAGASSDGSMNGGYGPMSGSQKASILFAGLRDMVNSFAGRSSNYLDQQGDSIYRNNQRDTQKALAAKIQAAYAKGDWDGVRSAIIEGGGNGMDMSHITSALKIGQPEIKAAGENVLSIDPLSGAVSTVYQGRPAPRAGYEWDKDGQSQHYIPGGPADPSNRAPQQPPPGFRWAPGTPPGTKLDLIPGYLDGQSMLSGARRAPKAQPTTGAIRIPHPGSMY